MRHLKESLPGDMREKTKAALDRKDPGVGVGTANTGELLL